MPSHQSLVSPYAGLIAVKIHFPTLSGFLVTARCIVTRYFFCDEEPSGALTVASMLTSFVSIWPSALLRSGVGPFGLPRLISAMGAALLSALRASDTFFTDALESSRHFVHSAWMAASLPVAFLFAASAASTRFKSSEWLSW